MKFFLIIPLVAVALVGSSICSRAQDNLLGRWHDAAPGGDPIGVLVIAKDSIVIGRKVTYQVKSVGPFGDGELFEVTGLNRKHDPEGCKPDGKVRYLAVQSSAPITPDVGGPAIRVFFYSGGSPPTAESIQNDIALCSIHPFGR